MHANTERVEEHIISSVTLNPVPSLSGGHASELRTTDKITHVFKVI